MIPALFAKMCWKVLMTARRRAAYSFCSGFSKTFGFRVSTSCVFCAENCQMFNGTGWAGHLWKDRLVSALVFSLSPFVSASGTGFQMNWLLHCTCWGGRTGWAWGGLSDLLQSSGTDSFLRHLCLSLPEWPGSSRTVPFWASEMAGASELFVS